MKTSEEIKKGLKCCVNGNMSCAGNCDYEEKGYSFLHCQYILQKDALALIQQLEEKVKAFEAETMEAKKWADRFERERDAAIHDLKRARGCPTCKYAKTHPVELPCRECGIAGRNFEWRGPCEENGGKANA